jgi:hypothetical protein
MGGVVGRAGAAHHHLRIGEKAPQQRDRTRRGGDELARLAQAQAELQHVPGLLGMAPFRELVAPGGGELRAAQGIRVLGREQLGNRPVRPDEPAQGRRPGRALTPGMNREQAGGPLHHHVARRPVGFTDEHDTARPGLGKARLAQGHAAHPLGTRAGFAGTAAAQHQPGGPGPARIGAAVEAARFGRDLVGPAGGKRPVPQQPLPLSRAQAVDVACDVVPIVELPQDGGEAHRAIPRRCGPADRVRRVSHPALAACRVAPAAVPAAAGADRCRPGRGRVRPPPRLAPSLAPLRRNQPVGRRPPVTASPIRGGEHETCAAASPARRQSSRPECSSRYKAAVPPRAPRATDPGCALPLKAPSMSATRDGPSGVPPGAAGGCRGHTSSPWARCTEAARRCQRLFS